MAGKIATKKSKKDHNSKTEKLNKFTLFYGKDSPFSQHHPATFTIDGVKYNCSEQYMMHQKAGMF